MAKEYFSLKNQVIEFDTDTQTMIVVISDDKFKTISVNTMSENVFNSQYLTFKAEVAKALVSTANISSSLLSDEERARLEYVPKDSNVNTFNEYKQQALDYFQNNL
jgi:hypothetical protein